MGRKDSESTTPEETEILKEILAELKAINTKLEGVISAIYSH